MLERKTDKEIKQLQEKFKISNRDKLSFRIVSNHFIDFLNDDRTIIPSKNVHIYFKTYATEEEKRLYLEKYEILAIQIKAILNTTKNLEILKRYYHTSDAQFIKLLSMYYDDQALIKKYLELFKAFYETARKCNWNKEILTEEASKYNMDYYDYRYLAIYYAKVNDLAVNFPNVGALNTLGYYKKDEVVKENKEHRTFTSPLYTILEMILKENEIAVYAPYFENYKINLGIINKFAYSYNYQKSREEQKQIEDNLKAKLEKSRVFYHDKYLISLYDEFLMSNLDFKGFVISKNLSLSYITKIVKESDNQSIKEKWEGLLKEHTKNCMEEIQRKIKLKNAENQNNKAKIYKEVADYLKNGIIVDNVKRDFDLIDFYLMYDIELSRNFKAFSFLTPEEKNSLNNFFKPIIMGSRFNKDAMLNANINMKINDQIYQVSSENIQKTIMFMEDNNIPFYNKLFDIALRKQVLGMLDSTLQR